jgi:hypothetical protein
MNTLENQVIMLIQKRSDTFLPKSDIFLAKSDTFLAKSDKRIKAGGDTARLNRQSNRAKSEKQPEGEDHASASS